MTGVLDRDAVLRAFARRREPGTALVADSGAVAAACQAMAARFHRGGRLLVFGNGGAATDAAHLAVEFVHPVLVGKRALPAMSLTNDAALFSGLAAAGAFVDTFATQVRLHARPDDIALGISASGRCTNVDAGLTVAAQLGLLTVALVGSSPDAPGPEIAASNDVAHVLRAASDDPRIVKEVHVTIYHVLWELVHVFLEQPGRHGPEQPGRHGPERSGPAHSAAATARP